MNGRMRLLAVGVPLAVLGVWPLTAATMSGAEPDVVIVQGGGDGYPTTTHPATTYPTTTTPATTTTIVTTNPQTVPTTTLPPTTLLVTTLPATTTVVPDTTPQFKKWFVCKYVGTPGVDERLQTGQNPISVSENAIPISPVMVGSEFADAQGRSLVIAPDIGQPEPDVSACPVPTGPTTTVPATTTTIDRCPPEDEPCVPDTTVTTALPTTTTIVGPTTSSPNGTTTSVVGTATSAAPTTTTLPETFTFSGAATVCVAEVPTIRITFQQPAQFPDLVGDTGTLTMSDVNGNVVSVQPLVYNPGSVNDLLYPGTSVNADGSIDDVPGWILTDDGFWIRDPSDEFLREGINLTYTLNPTATAFVSYPPESSTCANPDGPFPPGTPINPITQLPFTDGANDTLPPAGGPFIPILIGFGVGALGVGFGFRRRFS